MTVPVTTDEAGVGRARIKTPLVQLSRDQLDGDDQCFYGYLVAESRALIVLHLVSDRYDLDGYTVLRREHVDRLSQRFGRRPLVQRALALKGLGPVPPAAGLDLTSMATLIRSADAAYPLIAIRDERVHATEFELGKLRLQSDDAFVIDRISTRATWDGETRRFRIDDVTRVDFDGEYERTLAMVAASRGQALPPRRKRTGPRRA